MQSAIAERTSANVGAQAARRGAGGEFVGIAAPLLELALKLRTGAIPASHEVRPVVADLLRQLDSAAAQIGATRQDADDVKFALVAFIDEVVLSPVNNFPLRDEWEQTPLQLEFFGEHLAGVKFFDRLDAAMRDIETRADVVEVYYLCLLFGYKGKYNISFLEGERVNVVKGVAQRLRDAGRLVPNSLSPHWQANDQPVPKPDPGFPLWAKFGLPALLLLAVVIYGLLYLLLRRGLGDVVQ
ncbi:MAG: DotU family type IV/VI secretion system protein [Acidobacteriota bacterium]|nr:DotU family type IV/VI secretion system protein [Acidobacteriota bacterium]